MVSASKVDEGFAGHSRQRDAAVFKAGAATLLGEAYSIVEVERIQEEEQSLRRRKTFHLLSDKFLSFLGGGSQAILVNEHPQMVHPLIPGFLRDIVVYPLAQFTAPRGLLETWKFSAELHTFHHSL